MQAKRKKWLLIVGGLAVFILLVATFGNGQIAHAAAPQCSDGIDNDGDGRIDAADPLCHTDGNLYNPASYDPNLDTEAGRACVQTCSYQPKAGRIIVEFDRVNKIKSNGILAESKTPAVSVSIPAGYYNISMNGIDGCLSRAGDAAQPNEIWKAFLMSGSELTLQTPVASDLADGIYCSEQMNENIQTNFFVAKNIDTVVAQHAAYPDTSSSNDLWPICIALDSVPTPPQCSDSIDNDGDGKIDMTDPGCSSPDDDSENQPPAITLLGLNPLTVLLNATFTDPGATSTDPEDGNLTSSIIPAGTVNTSATGTYPILYTVTDSGGLTATTTRTVLVVQSPAIYQCSDGLDNDGDDSIDINDKTCHSDAVATNTVSYLPSKNTENELPVITLIGTASMEIFVGDAYTDQGATANDFEDGNITGSISATGTVADQTAGTYKIFYDVKDSQGAPAQQQVRTVVVKVRPPSGCVVNCGGGPVIPPTIPSLSVFNEKVEVRPDNSVLITWQTDANADSRVVYGTSSVVSLAAGNANYGYTTTSLTANDLILNHSLLITNLQPDKNYYFRPVSDNPSVNPVTGKELALIISQQPPMITGTVVPPAIIDCNYLLEYLRIDLPNNPVEVVKLQRFLKQNEGFADLPVNGVFDQATLDAVNIFQMRYFVDVLIPWGYDYNDPTGYVYITTKKKVNEIYCQKPLPLTSGQEDEITDMRNYLQALPQEVAPQPATTTAPVIGQSEGAGNLATNPAPVEALSAGITTTTEQPSDLANIGDINSAGAVNRTDTGLPETAPNQAEPSFLAGFVGRLANATNVLLLIASLIAFLIALSFVYVIVIIKRKRKQSEPYFAGGSASPLPMNFSVVDGLPVAVDKL